MNEEDEEIDRILNMSDGEIDAELRADGIDPQVFAQEARAQFERAIKKVRQMRCLLCGLKKVRGCTACFYYCKDCQG
jgi:hypothetical protein